MTLDLDKLQKLCDEATPGPWWHPSGDKDICRNNPIESVGWDHNKGNWHPNSDNNYKFIAEARTALPELISRVRELEKKIDIWRGVYGLKEEERG
ncbi:MAG: hypothetical protein GY861_18780 [bacterium]|nr:hypothetical protein [bacterium]